MNEIPLQYLILGIIVLIVATFMFVTGIMFDIHEFKNRKKWEALPKQPKLYELFKQLSNNKREIDQFTKELEEKLK